MFLLQAVTETVHRCVVKLHVTAVGKEVSCIIRDVSVRKGGQCSGLCCRRAGHRYAVDRMSLCKFFFGYFDHALPVVISTMPYTSLSVIWAGTIGPLHVAVPKDSVSSRSYDLKNTVLRRRKKLYKLLHFVVYRLLLFVRKKHCCDMVLSRS